MNVVGIIAEYNPFHNGHRRQIEQIRQRIPGAACLAVISGSFTQRGDAAILDKWQRAAIAVENGIDLVLELPLVFSLRSAQHFAAGGVRLLDRLGIVSTLAFGSELHDMSALESLARQSLAEASQARLRQGLQQGISYAAALAAALTLPPGLPADSLRQPNTILALEYLKALRQFSSAITPLALPREGAAYHDDALHDTAASASAIRRALRRGQRGWEEAVPLSAIAPLAHQQERGLPQDERLFQPLLLRLLTADPAELRQIYGISEGLEHRFQRAARTSTSLAELRQAVASRRYPAARIARTSLSLLLSLRRDTIAQFDAAGPLYGRILAFNSRGRQLLRQMNRAAALPLITRAADFLRPSRRQAEHLAPAATMLALDTIATDLRGLTLTPRRPAMQDFTTSPSYICGAADQR